MRRFDKKLKLTKANLLAENRYLKSKSLINERYIHRNASAEIKIEYGGYTYLKPIFEGEVTIESGAFDYEYGDIRGTHDPGEDAFVENVDWNHKDFTPEQNQYIQNYYNKNQEEVDNALIKDFYDSMENYY